MKYRGQACKGILGWVLLLSSPLPPTKSQLKEKNLGSSKKILS